MTSLIQDEFARLRIPRSNTVVRVGFALQRDPAYFDRACRLVEEWWNDKARPYDLEILPATRSLQESRDKFKIDFARDESRFSLSMEEPDSSIEDRTWAVDIALVGTGGSFEFGLRASYRQPLSLEQLPAPRAPRFLRNIIEDIGAVDVWPLESSSQPIDITTLKKFQSLVLDNRRTLPVIVVSEDDRIVGEDGQAQVGTACDPDKLARLLAGTAQVFRLSAEASYGLSRDWGKEMSVFRGAVRCYSRHFSCNDDKFNHRLWLPESIARADAFHRDGFINAVSHHVFTQITAYFESVPLQTPSLLRRGFVDRNWPLNVAERPPAIVHGAPLGPRKEPDLSQNEVPYGVGDQRYAEAEERVKSQTEKLAELDRTIVKLESDLEQERAGRAASEQSLAEQQQWCELYKEENDHLRSQQSILQGRIGPDEIEVVRNLWSRFRDLFEQMDQFTTVFRRIRSENDQLHSVSNELEQSKIKVANLTATVGSLTRRTAQNSAGSPSDDQDQLELSELLPQLVLGDMRLDLILQAAEVAYPHRVSVLESAYQSAKESNHFQHGRQAFELIWKLVTIYWQTIGLKGDAEARKCFGKSYAAKESEKLSKAGRERRTFVYKGQDVLMERHLKIGTADNKADTFRLHFEWMPDETRIVIGHCGKHLDF